MGSAMDVVKSITIPLFVAATIYLLLSYVLLPFYRRYREDISRYSQYAPLTTSLQSTTSLFSDYIPEALRPRSVRERLGDLFVRYLLPSSWRGRQSLGLTRDGHERRDSVSSNEDDDGGLFDEESGERMVGFDMNHRQRRANGTSRSNIGFGIRDARENNAIRAASGRPQVTHDDASIQRLSRELESGFVDDSDSELSDEQVTVGRRRLSMSANR